MELSADDDELFQPLFESPQLEIEAMIALVGTHGAKYSALSARGSTTPAAVIAFTDAPSHRTFAIAVTAGSHISTNDYDALRESLSGSGTIVSLAELHGGLCGALCAGGPTAAEHWLDGFLSDSDAADAAGTRAVGVELERSSWAALDAAELAFEPLLPSEDAPLDEQVQALALWCSGFLNGVGASAPDLVGRNARPAAAAAIASAEVAEILGDFTEMSRAGVDDEDVVDRDRAGFALAELKEYVRVSVQIVFEQLADRREAAARDVH